MPSSRSTDEFAPDAARWPAGLSRRHFLQVAAAGLALAGVGPGCFKRPREAILPYVNAPEDVLPGVPSAYATTYRWHGWGRGLLATCHQGRPVKLEGHPDHPASLGATDAAMQAHVLGLYDPGRRQSPLLHGRTATWGAFDAAWLEQAAQLDAQRGDGLWIVAHPTTSPSELAAWQRLAARWPELRLVWGSPRDAGEPPPEDLDLAAADVIVGLDPDFLTEHPESLRYARAFASRREGETMSRFFSLHAAPTVTNAQADFPLLAAPDRWPTLFAALADEATGDLPEPERRWLERVQRDLPQAGPRALFVGGRHLSADLTAAIARLNERIGNLGTTRHAISPPPRLGDVLGAQMASRTDLVEALQRRTVKTLLCLEANPTYLSPELARLWPRAAWAAHFGIEPDETGPLTTWQLPLHHDLEDWGDLRSFTGVLSPVQPLVQPLYASRSRLEVLHRLAAPTDARPAYDLVRAHWQARLGDDFDDWWYQGLRTGVFDPVADASEPVAPRRPAQPVRRVEASRKSTTLRLLVRPDPTLEDGRLARNAWLQELPKPISQLVWDTALWISPETAAVHGLSTGDLVELHAGKATATLPVLPLPGVAPGVLVAFLGGGRPSAVTHEGQEAGFALGGFAEQAEWPAVELRRTGQSYPLVTTQHHQTMEGHDFVRVHTVGEPPPPEPSHDSAQSSFMPEPPDLPGSESPYEWAMSIDLSRCIGCAACVVACQAENNIPVVGKAQVAAGREMHWLRIDRYFQSAPHGLQILQQPIPCMHCEKAPCEVVCPVAATLHDREGLNAMIYNRCVGTRYCSNNCPYKVRRFNFLDYRQPEDDPRILQSNPDVTVRERGVMEKCTYCVQRISRARRTARVENRRIHDGEVRTACQQACPTEAIVFGNLWDAESTVVRAKAKPGSYALLAELDTRPRTTYLPRWQPRDDAS